MIISISGTPGSGKSTVGRLLAKKLNFKHYSSGDFMRDMAEEQKISLLELSKQAETDPTIDQEIDDRQIQLGIKEDDFIIDARLGYHFIKKAKKIYLDADIDERSKRILADIIRTEHNITLEKTKKDILTRQESEKRRYQEYYRLNPYDQSQYDLIIDTTKLTPKEVVEKILDFIKE